MGTFYDNIKTFILKRKEKKNIKIQSPSIFYTFLFNFYT